MQSLEELRKMNSTLKKVVDSKDKSFCSNSKCNKKTAGLIEADSFARVYFGVRDDNQPWKICGNCQSKADKALKEAVNEIKTEGNIFNIKFGAIVKEAVTEIINLDQNDTETVLASSSRGVKMPTSTGPLYSVSDSKLTSVIKEIMDRYHIKELIEKTKKTLSKEIDDLENGLAEDDQGMEVLAKKISELGSKYNELVSNRTVRIELGAVDIQNDTIKVVENENLSEKLVQYNLSAGRREVLDFRRTVTYCTEEKREKKVAVRKLSEGSDDMKVSKLAHSTKQNRENMPPVASKNAPIAPTLPGRKLVFGLPKVNQMVYAMHGDLLNYWLPAKIISIVSLGKNNSVVTVELQKLESYLKSLQSNSMNLSGIKKTLTGKQIAFTKPPGVSVILPFGTRVIAKFYDALGSNPELKNLFYAGIVAETPCPSNRNRYLLFFDDGYPQYTRRDEVIPIVETSASIWEDVHTDIQDFTKKFISRYPNIRMFKATVGGQCKLEYEGKWLQARVVEVDCSLMKVKYPVNSPMEYEWIYMGSLRIRNLYGASNGFVEPVSVGSTRNARAYGAKNGIRQIEQPCSSFQSDAIKKEPVVFTCHETAGSTHKIQIPEYCPLPKNEYKLHKCSPSCVYVYAEADFRETSPLVVPFHLGWAREFRGLSLGNVAYITPCGMRLTKYEEIHVYNRITQNNIPIEFFSLEPYIDCLNQFHAAHQRAFSKDISKGKEWTPVQCINSISNELPQNLEYLSQRKPAEGVKINLDCGFLACCDCEDDCKDKTKCACWQLTLSGISFKKKPALQGYENRRLKQWTESGIYECNNKCKCRASTTCLNKVVQSKVKWPVQVFKTVKKGWGVRALYDMPKGSFICVYTGKLLNDAGANQEGLQNGDEYLADLDYIEVMESVKEGYESDCSEITDEEEECDDIQVIEELSIDQRKVLERKEPQIPVARKSTAGRNKTLELKRLNSDGQPSAKKEDGQVSSNGEPSKPIRYRRYFGKHEKPYIVDGKRHGNFGRYFNHSCDPNIFIQNVFVDTHDLRFPWVAFFTKKDVKAGTELCWDYKYQVGSVPGKRLDCYCGAKNCRGRLL